MHISISHHYCIKRRRIVQTDLIFGFAFVAHPLGNACVFKSNQSGVESDRCSVNYFFFHRCEVALTSHICFPIRLVFHQMASVEIAIVCGLKVRVGCQDRLCVNSDADETLA